MRTPLVTTSDEDEDIARSYELQANAYVTKPIGLDQLGRVVRAIDDFWFEGGAPASPATAPPSVTGRGR